MIIRTTIIRCDHKNQNMCPSVNIVMFHGLKPSVALMQFIVHVPPVDSPNLYIICDTPVAAAASRVSQSCKLCNFLFNRP